jgi:hypothetical protein
LKSANLLYPVALIDFDVACIRAPTVKSQVSDRHDMDFLHRVVSEVESAKDAPSSPAYWTAATSHSCGTTVPGDSRAEILPALA